MSFVVCLERVEVYACITSLYAGTLELQALLKKKLRFCNGRCKFGTVTHHCTRLHTILHTIAHDYTPLHGKIRLCPNIGFPHPTYDFVRAKGFFLYPSRYICLIRPMSKRPQEVIQISITMEKKLKERYAKLAVELDVSLSQLVRFALRQVDEGIQNYEALHKLRDRSETRRE